MLGSEIKSLSPLIKSTAESVKLHTNRNIKVRNADGCQKREMFF